MMTSNPEQIPLYEFDFYADEAIQDPVPHYRALLDAGPLVWMTRHDAWAIARFDVVRAALRNPRVFASGRGVMMNEATNALAAGSSVLCLDAPAHEQWRRILSEPLMPKAVVQLREQLTELCEVQVEALMVQGRFDAVTELAHLLPVSIVAKLVGLPAEGQANML